MATTRTAGKTSKASAVTEPLLEVGGREVLNGLRSSLAWLQANQEQINDLNVFPVPDGDTGSNMFLTLRGALEEAEHAEDRDSAAAVLGAAAHGSLMGARGNSGVILSQVLRGFAAGAGSGITLDGNAIAEGLSQAAAVAYKAVIKPTEGTILTVVREAGSAAKAAAADTSDIRVILGRATQQAHVAVENTTSQLRILADAGVVDAGGFGFAVILEGFAKALEGDVEHVNREKSDRPLGEPRVIVPGAAAASGAPPRTARKGAAAVAAREEGWGYCTEFLMHGPGLDADAVRTELSAMGESALIVGDADLVRVHIHTPEPAALIAAASARARLSKLKVEDMTAQHHDVLDRADTAEKNGNGHAERAAVSVVAVAPGDGFVDILMSLGCAAVVPGGQTMNPSIEDLVTAVGAANADSVIVLPNNGNVIMTAQQVDALSDSAVQVVPAKNLPQGLSAMLAFDGDESAESNVARMKDAMRDVTAIEVTRAVRDSSAAGLAINEGDVIAVVDGDITGVGDNEGDVIEAALRRLDGTPEIVTLYRGGETPEAASSALVARLEKAFTGVQFELHNGGQTHYSYIISVE
jgi:DAK2 domain fusion protein YloV